MNKQRLARLEALEQKAKISRGELLLTGAEARVWLDAERTKSTVIGSPEEIEWWRERGQPVGRH
jgi:hypothetical protein